jgi:hypothetical protein
VDEAQILRKLAAWYRGFAERASEPWIWEARLRRAEALEQEAAREEFRSKGAGNSRKGEA